METSWHLTLAALDSFDPLAPKHGTDWRFCCPFCGDEKPRDSAHRSLSLHADTGKWHCHRCDASGKLREQIDGAPVPYRAPNIFDSALPANSKALRVPRLLPLAGTPGEAYLLGRGIAADAAHAAGVRYAPSWGHWQKDGGRWKLLGTSRRIVFPVRDAYRTLVAYQGRAISGEEYGPRMHSRGGISKGVFATPGAMDRDPVTLVESPIDALSLFISGLPAVALLGKDNLPVWLPAALAHRHVFIGLDADAAGDAAVLKLARLLIGKGAEVERLRPCQAKDWNEMLTRAPRLLEKWIDVAMCD